MLLLLLLLLEMDEVLRAERKAELAAAEPDAGARPPCRGTISPWCSPGPACTHDRQKRSVQWAAVRGGHNNRHAVSSDFSERAQLAVRARLVWLCACPCRVMCPCACLPARLCALVGVASHAPWASEQSRSSTTTSGWPSITVGWWVGGWVGGSVVRLECENLLRAKDAVSQSIAQR